jgi:N-[(2S)-2-amino-2-carboxyethyl]-L-glutamate dehydrogenase
LRENDLLILRGNDVVDILAGKEKDLIEMVRKAYEAHVRGESSLPHSAFLNRLPLDDRNRIIALPAYVGGEFEAAGVKWISSFPANTRGGEERASAVIVLNSLQTGRPETVMEGSVISAKRTAASAALAAQQLHDVRQSCAIGLIGCGLINFEVTRFLLTIFTHVSNLTVFDLNLARAEQFRQMCRLTLKFDQIEVAKDVNSILRHCSLISMATTAASPHITDLSECLTGSTILHISLRDLSPEVILGCDNVVDDADHVCRAQTSLHLAERLVNNRDFIRCSIGEILTGGAPSRRDAASVTVFSPFGLGILDVAVAKFVRDAGASRGLGTMIESFIPPRWHQSPSPGPTPGPAG